MILKPNMVLPGLTCPKQPTADEVADATVGVLRRVVPVALPGIAFLSGGQSGVLASERLNAMNSRFKSPSAAAPWALTFSFARAIQQPALEIWAGKDTNREAAQRALLHRARCNRAARQGLYTRLMEATPPSGFRSGMTDRAPPPRESFLFDMAKRTGRSQAGTPARPTSR